MQVNARRDAPKRNAHCTKAGPGRRHVDGHKRASPIATKGAPLGFEARANQERAAKRRRVKAFGGRRQYLKTVKALRRARKAMVAA